jgi:hypothetical protein
MHLMLTVMRKMDLDGGLKLMPCPMVVNIDNYLVLPQLTESAKSICGSVLYESKSEDGISVEEPPAAIFAMIRQKEEDNKKVTIVLSDDIGFGMKGK